jgi:hypothetical protein
MPLSDNGKSYMASVVMGESVTPFDFAHAMIGVGNSSASVLGIQADLLGGQKFRAPMDVGYPKKDPDDPSIVIFRATFNEADANFDWTEWGIFNSAPSTTGGLMLIRTVEFIGNKEFGSVWIFTASIKFENNV